MMDRPSQLKFVRQNNSVSKAIAIVDPSSLSKPPRINHNSKPSTEQPGTAVPEPSSNLPTSTSTRPTSTISRTKPTRISAKTPPVYDSEDDSAIEDNGRPFNVYARSFVPQALTIINTLNGHKIDTPAMNQINFEAYSRNSLGLGPLPPIPQPIEVPLNAPARLTAAHYELYFRYHLEAEIKSQRQENESYSLYGHDVTAFSQEPAEPAVYSLIVPGLRENSPYIEEGDVIELRQLYYEYVEQLPIHMSHPSKCTFDFSPVPGQRGNEGIPRWTGVVYNARVTGVQRKQERILVGVSGITTQSSIFGQHHLNSGKRQLKFNVQFPVPMKRYLPMQHVLPIVQKALTKVNESENQDQNMCESTKAAYTIPSPTDPAIHSSPRGAACEARQSWLQSMLFPTEGDCTSQTKLNTGSLNRPFFDEKLNWEQRKAIESICSQNYGALPFLVSGPPGTGKTKTLVETALQLVKNIDKISHILFCAPSDPAADILVQRLSVYLKPAELLRLNRPSRTFAEVPGDVLLFCHVSQNVFCLPPFKSLMSFRIVVTTCRDASLLMYSRMTNSDLHAAEYGIRNTIHPFIAQPSQVHLHWTAVLIDEAAQAIESEALIPLSVVAPPSEFESTKLVFSPLFVMAGDEHQLGPRTSMNSTPLKTSLFARLFARPTYAYHPLARKNAGKAPPALKRAMLPILRPAFANLIRNYRSHPAILAVPSALFYADTLVPEATDTDRLASWSEWRGRRWPVLFVDNNSKDELEKDGGGWYNVDEAHIACRYAAHLVRSGLVEQNEVCIMSPFKAQVQRLRNTIRDQQYGSLWNVDIGPTEAFQGLERGIVILCTTRSKQRFLNNDKELGWGIVGMPDKMNVAVTRAKFGLIVIGKREILFQDPTWDAFLAFCDRNGLVTNKYDFGTRLNHGLSVKFTRLEKVLLAQERDLYNRDDSRIMKGIDRDDEMWTSGMQVALHTEDLHGFGHNDQDEDEDK